MKTKNSLQVDENHKNSQRIRENVEDSITDSCMLSTDNNKLAFSANVSHLFYPVKLQFSVFSSTTLFLEGSQPADFFFTKKKSSNESRSK